MKSPAVTWYQTSPREFSVRAVDSSGEPAIDVKPCWISSGGIGESGKWSYAMLIEELEPGAWRIHCAHGLFFEPDVAGIVAEIRLVKDAT